MIAYDRHAPLIAIHIPKSAGSSAREVFRRWFGAGFHRHYYDEVAGALPPRRDLAALHSPETPVCLYGHFNRLRGFGVEDYYPEVRQFVTILRDPFELTVSHYFFTRKRAPEWKDRSRLPRGDLADYLARTPPNMLNHFPRPVTRDNYRDIFDEFFVEVGITERLDESLARIARALGRPPPSPGDVPRLNVTSRDQTATADLRAAFMARHPLEFEVYAHAAARFGS